MGGCVSSTSFTVNKQKDLKFISQPILFSIFDAENVLREAEPNDYLLYKDHDSDKIILSVRLASYIRHYRITELNSLYYLEGQPYAYLDSIVLYHRKHKLNGVRLNKQAPLSARVVRTFAHRVAKSNGNLHIYTNKNIRRDSHSLASNDRSRLSNGRHSRNSSNASLLTASSDSTGRRPGLS
ncbi:hypothetical protein BsWGS_07276 [Bradybaena similaris]